MIFSIKKTLTVNNQVTKSKTTKHDRSQDFLFAQILKTKLVTSLQSNLCIFETRTAIDLGLAWIDSGEVGLSANKLRVEKALIFTTDYAHFQNS
jgi:hypothetical protein